MGVTLYGYGNTGAVSRGRYTGYNNASGVGGTQEWIKTVDTSLLNSVYGKSDTVTPLSRRTTFLIRY